MKKEHPSRVDVPYQYQGHDVPQVVPDVKVFNALPKDDVIELVKPLLRDMKIDVQDCISRCEGEIKEVKNQMNNKAESAPITERFMSIYTALKALEQRIIALEQNQSRFIAESDLDMKLKALVDQRMMKQESTPAGKVSYTCLFCGAKKYGGVSGTSGAGAPDSSQTPKIVKGLANSKFSSNLPPLSNQSIG